MAETTDPIIVEQSFNVPKVLLWQAITKRDQMVQWFFEEIPDFKAESGFETHFNINTGERDFNHLWKITTAAPGEKIVYDWRYEGYDGAGIVTFELFDKDDGSRLRLTAEGTETFPQEIPEFKRESGVAGREYFIQGSLKEFLEPGIRHSQSTFAECGRQYGYQPNFGLQTGAKFWKRYQCSSTDNVILMQPW